MKTYPALEIRGADPDRLSAAIDDLPATAIEDRDHAVRVFFSTTSARDLAQSALSSDFDAVPIEVSDDDWARRSQEKLQPVTVGRITVVPDPECLVAHPLTVVIRPSMGFGTGHHVTTRLCLEALQAIDLTNAFVLDVGAGSGVLAIAACRLGAAGALGIDHDADAVESAQQNLALNPAARGVTFEVTDLQTATLPQADIVTANLTGAVLVRFAHLLVNAVRAGGTLILSGLLWPERDDVVEAFEPLTIVWEREEDGWVGLAVKKA